MQFLVLIVCRVSAFKEQPAPEEGQRTLSAFLSTVSPAHQRSRAGGSAELDECSVDEPAAIERPDAEVSPGADVAVPSGEAKSEATNLGGTAGTSGHVDFQSTARCFLALLLRKIIR